MRFSTPVAPRSSGLWRLAFFALFAAMIYLSWKPNPGIKQVKLMPTLLANWFDEHDGWKNFIGFGLLALALLMGWREPGEKRSPNPIFASLTRELKLFAAFCCLVVLLEIGQLALPRRVCDWRDVLVGWLGGLIVWMALNVPRWIRGLAPKFR